MPKLRFPGKPVNLSVEQYRVVKGAGNFLVLACPGSGKTRLLTCRAAHLFQKNPASSKRIILITFTQKASHEMMERVKQLIPEDYKSIMVGTFHHVAYQVLRHCDALPKEVRIIDEDEQMVGWDTVAGNDKERMSCLYQRRVYQPDMVLEPVELLFIERYLAWKGENGYIDFSDIILLFIKFLQSEQSELFHQAYSHILVDECQDLNQLQFTILREFFPNAESITLVGDIAQSIYGFRHANPEIVYRCEKEFKLIRSYLTTNYRNAPDIVALANQLVPREMEAGSRSVFGKDVVSFDWHKSEFTFLVSKIEEELRAGTPLRKMMVMARSHWYLNLAATVLRKNNIGVRVKHQPIHQRSSGKKLIALLRIKEKTHTSLDLLHWNHWDDVTGQLEDLGYHNLLDKALGEFSVQDAALIRQKLQGADNAKDSIKALLREEPKPDSKGVLLCSIHQSKGMEYPICFLIGAADQYIPHSKADSVEEEKRLLYVAVTRAIGKLYISCGKKVGKVDCEPTRFLREIMEINEEVSS